MGTQAEAEGRKGEEEKRAEEGQVWCLRLVGSLPALELEGALLDLSLLVVEVGHPPAAAPRPRP